MNKLLEIKTGIPFAETQTVKIDIPNSILFSKLLIVHNVGTPQNPPYLANTVLDSIRLFVNGKEHVSLVGDVDTKKVPWAIALNREVNRYRNMVVDTDEHFVIDLPDAAPYHHNAYLLLRFNTIANLTTTTSATYTGASIDVFAVAEDKIPGRAVQLLRSCGKFDYGAQTGRMTYFLNPSEAGYKTQHVLGIVEDNGTPSDTAIAKLVLKIGDQTLFEGPLKNIQTQMKMQFGVAPDPGFFLLPVGRHVLPSELSLTAEKTAAGNDVEIHWMLTSVL